MPVFTLQGPDGRTIDIEAADQATAMRGAQEWASANPAPAKAKPKSPSLIDQVGSAVGGAVDKLKSDVTAGINRRPATSLSGSIADTLPSLGRTATLVGDVVGIPGAAVGAVQNALVSRPYGQAMSAITGGGYPEDRATADMNTALMGAMPGRAGLAAAPKVSALADAAADTVARFDRARVRPMLAAGGGKGAATVTNVIAENPVAGIRVRNQLQGAVGDAGAQANALAGQYGETRGPQITGENIQAGVNRFANGKAPPPASVAAPARQTTFSAKATALYDQAFDAIDKGQQAAVAQSQSAAGLRNARMGNFQAAPAPVVDPSTTRATLQAMGGRVNASLLSDIITDPRVSKIASALQDGSQDLRFGDLRALRTWVREAQKDPQLRQNMTQAGLQSLEGSLTSDIYQNAEKLGGPQAVRQLQRADQYYRAGQQRIQTALQPFDSAKSGESAYARLGQALGSSSTADAAQALAVKRSLSADEWGDVAANVLSELGKPKAGVAVPGEPGFSVSEFVTKYEKLPPRSKDILFGSVGGGGAKASALRAELDNLVSVASDLKGIEKGANTSKTFVNAQAWGTGIGLVTPHTTIPTAMGLLGAGLTGEAMTNPVVVRWLARSTRAAQQGPQQLGAVNRQLRIAAGSNAALQPLLHQTTMLLEAPRAGTPAAATSQSEQDQ